MIDTLISKLLDMDRYFLISQSIIIISVVVLFTAILFDFVLFENNTSISKEKKSMVETGTMTLFLLLFVIVLRYTLDYTWEVSIGVSHMLSILGAVIVLIGSILNVIGRFSLGDNWANHIKIYKDHRLVNEGLYKIVRHPLYSSIMLMFIGASIAYLNIYSFILEMVVFVPFMYYRAKQEEKLLTERFPEYINYKKTTGMFIPKLIKGR